MASKHKDSVLAVLSKDEIKSTNEIKREAEEVSGKKINWYIIHRILSDLAYEGKIEKLESKGGFVS